MGDEYRYVTEHAETRAAQRGDLDRVAQVWHASAAAAAGAAPEVPAVEDLRARIDAELAGAWTLFVASQENCIVGMLAVNKAERILDQLFVSPSMQRRGIGKTLLKRAMVEMPAGFTLRTASVNVNARAFYERMGLRLLSEGSHPGRGHPVCFYGWKHC